MVLWLFKLSPKRLRSLLVGTYPKGDPGFSSSRPRRSGASVSNCARFRPTKPSPPWSHAAPIRIPASGAFSLAPCPPRCQSRALPHLGAGLSACPQRLGAGFLGCLEAARYLVLRAPRRGRVLEGLLGACRGSLSLGACALCA
jgi:hypothetical protein